MESTHIVGNTVPLLKNPQIPRTLSLNMGRSKSSPDSSGRYPNQSDPVTGFQSGISLPDVHTKESENKPNSEESSKSKVKPFLSLRDFHLKPAVKSENTYVTDEMPPSSKTDTAINSQTTQRDKRVLVHEFFTVPAQNTFSSLAGCDFRVFTNRSCPLSRTVSSEVERMVLARNPVVLLPSSSHSDYSDPNLTPDPFSGLYNGPHEAPHPAESYHAPKRSNPVHFHDQFSQLMEDRMVMFRPSTSQNNVERTLNMTHPYQRSTELETVRMRDWFHANVNRHSSHRNSPQHDPSELCEVSPPSGLFINNSISSFMPQGESGPFGAENEHPSMEYTPRAIPLTEIKRPPMSPMASSCLCWPF